MNSRLNRLTQISAGLALVLSLPAAAAGLVMRDDFSDRSSGWVDAAATHHTDLGFAVYTDMGAYQMTPVTDNAFGFIPAPKQAEGGNVRIESDLFLYAGVGKGASGLICRYQDHDNFYGFLASGDATIAIIRVKDGKAETLASGSVETVMAGTVDSRLSAECKGDSLSFSVRDGSSISATDSTFSNGKSGLAVIGEKSAGTSGVFDNFVLTDLGTN